LIRLCYVIDVKKDVLKAQTGKGSSLLNLVEVRPITQKEKTLWRSLMRQHHYLGFGKTAGESILYVATINGIWVGLLGWAAAALHVRVRDKWIGWDAVAKKHRLHLVTNNVRFLVLPGVHVKNLASKILSVNIKRLSSDWQNFYGHPILLAETFVDPSRFKGTCYLAAGWKPLGETDGFGRNPRGGYIIHGNPKIIFVHPLLNNIQGLLSDPYFEIKSNKEKVFMIDVRKLPLENKGGLIDVLRRVEDPRSSQGRRHSQISILAIATCAMLSGAKSFSAIAEWAKNLSARQLKRMHCRRGTSPSESTIERVLQRINPEEFDTKINDWLFQVANSSGKGLAVDGKTLRGSHDNHKKPIHLLSALLHEEKVIIAQRNVESKTNEITQFKPLLQNLPLEGIVVTADPMHCQVEHAIFLVRDKKADFIFTVKDNQPNLRKQIKCILAGKPDPVDVYHQIEKAHGRIDTHLIVAHTISPHEMRNIAFPYIKQCFSVKRISTDLNGENQKIEIRYGITSLSRENALPKELLCLLIGHWRIETSSHYVRDDTLGEDRSRIRKGSGPQIMATLRNVSIGMIRVAGGENIAEAIRYFGWNGKAKAIRAIGI
jgi:predicted transposase YbfD/YdcC